MRRMSRYDLTDSEWRVIEPLLPNKLRGVPRVDDRRVLNGILKNADAERRLWRSAVEGPRTSTVSSV
jgi:transposase